MVKAAEKGSITDAAKVLGVTHDTMSESISQVERELGFRIFVRRKAGVAPTKRGMDMLGRARRVVDEMNAFENYYETGCSAQASFTVSTLNFGFVEQAMVCLAADPINKCCELVLESSRLSKIVADVSSGLSDLGVVYLTEENKPSTLRLLDRAGLEFEELFSATAHAWLNRSHPLANKDVVTLEDLELYPRLSFGQYCQVVNKQDVSDKPAATSYIEGVETRGSAIDPFDLLCDIEEIDGYVVWCNLQPEVMLEEQLLATLIVDAEPMAIGYAKQRGAVLGDMSVEFVEQLKRTV